MNTELLWVLIPLAKLILAVFAVRTIQHMIRDNAQVDGEPALTRGVATLGERCGLEGGRAVCDPRRRLVAQTLTLRGDLHGWPVVWTFALKDTRNGNLSLDATALALRLPEELASVGRVASRAPGAAPSAGGWATGDAAFDARFDLTADAPEAAARLLTCPARAALLALASAPGAAVTLEGGVLTVRRALRAEIDVATMRATFAALPELFEGAAALRAALHDACPRHDDALDDADALALAALAAAAPARARKREAAAPRPHGAATASPAQPASAAPAPSPAPSPALHARL